MTDRNQPLATVFPMDRSTFPVEVVRQRRRSIIREFALNTSTHGLPGIARSHSKHNRLFWSISTIAFTCVMIYFVTQSIRVYFDYPTQTKVDIVVEWPIPFPAFTFCNYCPVRYDRSVSAVLAYMKQFNLTDNSTTTLAPEHIIYFRHFLQYKIEKNESMTEYFYPLKAMLMSCSFNGIACQPSDFISFESSFYGQCYTYNAQIKNQPNGGVRDSNEGGGNGILQLALYTHSQQYVPYLCNAVGMMTMLHDNRQLPLIEVAGMAIGPGRRHRLTFTRKKTDFLSAPYSDCTNKIPLGMQAMFNRFEGADYAYSQLICFTNCIQAYTYQECGCVNPTQWAARSVNIFGTETIVDAPLCEFFNPCYSEAADRLMKNYSIWSVHCFECAQECQTMDFGQTLSSMTAPVDWMLDGIRAFVENSSMTLASDWSTNWQSHVRSNYIAIEIVRETLQLEKLTQQASLSGTDVLANVGGQSGLWIGISFLSLMELTEMLYRLWRSNFHLLRMRIRERLRRKPPPGTNHQAWINTNAFS